jgi:predicted  nucleic acid-binding Zn-ribbon protein
MEFDPGHPEPTQALLTALGRFQRQVAKAQTGARQDEWSDECMNQLISAVEIAIQQDWADVVEALTDTARLLHTYEDAGRAQRCVPFLADSYEHLCLMVGDLIVDNVRPSVVDKWRRRFTAAMEDLQAEGLTLIQDDDSDMTGAAAASAPPLREQPAAATAATVSALPEDAALSALDDDLPALDDLPPLQGVEHVGIESIAPHTERYDIGLDPIDPMDSDVHDTLDSLPEMPMIGEVGYLPTDPEPAAARGTHAARRPAAPRFEPAPVSANGDGDPDDMPMADGRVELTSHDHAADPAPAELADLEEPAAEEATEEPAAHEETPVPPRLEPAVVQHLDALCDDLTRLERGDGVDHAAIFAMIDGRLDALCNHAHSGRRNGAERLSHTMLTLCRHVADHPEQLQDKFFELAFAFCGLYADADNGDDTGVENSWSAEVTAFEESHRPFAAPAQSAPDAPGIEIPDLGVEASASELELEEREPEDAGASDDPGAGTQTEPPAHPELEAERADAADSAEPWAADGADALMKLLMGAQAAAAQGDIVHAKALALQAAVQIAEAEVTQAADALAQVDHQLEANAGAMEDAHIGATAAEAQLGESESRATDVEAALHQARQHASETQGRLEGIERHIHEIDEQIRALQAERDAELARGDEVRAELEQQQNAEHAELANLEQCREEEALARRRLEGVRQEIARLEQQRETTKTNRSGAEAKLEEKRQSLSELEQTVRLIQTRLAASQSE